LCFEASLELRELYNDQNGLWCQNSPLRSVPVEKRGKKREREKKKKKKKRIPSPTQLLSPTLIAFLVGHFNFFSKYNYYFKNFFLSVKDNKLILKFASFIVKT